MEYFDLKPCKKAVMLRHVNPGTKAVTYKTIDTGLYYGEPILEENRTYSDLEYELIRLRFQKLEGYKAANRWIEVKDDKKAR